MLAYALHFNKKMKRAFKRNRVKIAEINSRIEDNLSGIRVVKSFANEAVETEARTDTEETPHDSHLISKWSFPF